MRKRVLAGWLASICAVPAMAAPTSVVKLTASRPAPKVVRLSLLPPDVRLTGPLARQRLLVVGTRADGSQVDLTDRAGFSSSAPTVAEVKAGRVTPRAN